MFAEIHSAVVSGLTVELVKVETDVSNGLPQLNMIGYLSGEVKEAGSRVKAALYNSGISLPPKRITVNFAPADVYKRGALLDLPVALSVACAMGHISAHPLKEHTLVIGEVGLNGRICSVSGVLIIVRRAFEAGFHRVLLPMENVQEGRLIKGIEVYGFNNLLEVFSFWSEGVIPKQPEISIEAGGKSGLLSDEIPPEIKDGYNDVPDFSDVYGQDNALRGALISASGYHNILFMGPPGSGKSMIARRLPGIMPPLTYEESMNLTGIYSAAGLLKSGTLMTRRPYRSPHHSVSGPALVGGGRVPIPGEITLADHGVLFLDELTEFKKPVLDLLRQPLEEHRLTVSRVHGSYEFPADILLLACANKCPCGYYPDLSRCRCSDAQIRHYMGRISGPIIDRIDMYVNVEAVDYEGLTGAFESGHQGIWTSDNMRKAVRSAWEIQRNRFRDCSFKFNARIPGGMLSDYCPVSERGQKVLKTAFAKLKLSARSYHRLLRVSRTIADLDESEIITSEHISEAIGYRGGETAN